MDHGDEVTGADSEPNKLSRLDSLNLEAGRVPSAYKLASKDAWSRTLRLAFQSIGVIYGDIGTSPLYVYASTFPDGIHDNDDLLAILSLIIYSLILVPMIKYVFIVLRANDQGDGGTFALYSLICRYARVGLVPNQQVEDTMVSNYKLKMPSRNLERAEKIKKKLETSNVLKISIFLTTILATSMVIGDGILTPCISVLSAVGGIKSQSSLNQDAVVGISIAILIVLFCAQRFGTDKVGYTFAPIILIWFTLIGGIGLYNLFKYDVKVLRALNPKYIIDYFKRNGRKGWISLGGVLLCITGTEAMFADLGHFNVRAVQISFTAVLFPAVSLAYIGQGAYLTKFPENVSDTFYKSIPTPLYWPAFVAAVAAAIIASQAMISGAFAIISQSLALGCFPRVKVVHTSATYEGQVYIPEVNYTLMAACIIVTASFKTTEKIGNAYGIAVVSVMLITTCLVSLVMVVIWKTSLWIVAIFFIVFGGIESAYFSSAMYKFKDGGFLPLALSFFLISVMGTWHYVHREKYLFELKNKVSSSYIQEVASNPEVRRIPGIGLLYSELVQGIPPIFPHFLRNVPSIHSVLIFVSIKRLPISHVSVEERFLFRQLGPRENRMFRCVVRCGYKDILGDPTNFEPQLVEYLKIFVHHDFYVNGGAEQSVAPSDDPNEGQLEESRSKVPSRDSSRSIKSQNGIQAVIEEEKQFIQRSMEEVIVYLLGEVQVVAAKNSPLFKRIIINHLYDFLQRNFRRGIEVLPIPRGRLLRVGMTYEI
ncbi:high affinity K+ transporter 5 [Wolffia australiana]